MLTRCYFIKVSNVLRIFRSQKCISTCIFRTKINQNYGQISINNVSQSKGFKKVMGGLTMVTSIWYETKKEDIEENLAHLITLAKLALERGDVDRAKDILQLGLQLCEEHKMYTAVPYLYDILSAIAISQGNIIQAQDLLVTAIEKLTMWGYPEEHYNVVDFKLRLARIYSTSGQDSLATMGFESCLNKQKTKILAGDTSEKTGILYVNILFWYGVHMIRNDMYIDARDMINTAFDYSMKIKGLSPKQEMIILYTLADLNTELGDFDIALQSMLNAIVLGKGIGSIDLPVCYLKLGTIYEKLGYFVEARAAYEEAIKTASIFGYTDVVCDAENALHGMDENKAGKL